MKSKPTIKATVKSKPTATFTRRPLSPKKKKGNKFV